MCPLQGLPQYSESGRLTGELGQASRSLTVKE